MKKEIINKFSQSLKKAKTVLITTHIIPDADGIGGQVALYYALCSLGKKVYCVNEEPLSKRYLHMEGGKKIILSYKEFIKLHKIDEIDIMIVVDTSEVNRLGINSRKLLCRAKESYCLDHHPINRKEENIFTQKIIDLKAAATGELVAQLIKSLGVPFNKKIALPLYTALLIDTSSFRYPTVTPKTHLLISELLETGINPARAYDLIYGTKKIGHMQLLGEVLLKAKINRDKTIAWVTITSDQLKKYRCIEEDTYSFVNYLLVLRNLKIALMFRDKNDKVRVSIRSAGVVDVDHLAQKIGGGGHNHSSAATIKGKLESVIPKVVRICQTHLKN